MKIFTCLLCHRTTLGKEKPTHCPFCGAVSKQLVHPKDHYDDDFFLQPKTKKLLQRIADDKKRNVYFYKKVSEETSDATLKHLFRALESIENHHVLVIERLGIKPNLIKERIHGYEFDEDNIAETFHKKTDSVNFLKDAVHEVDDPYVTELLAAMLEVEEEHVRLVEEYM